MNLAKIDSGIKGDKTYIDPTYEGKLLAI